MTESYDERPRGKSRGRGAAGSPPVDEMVAGAGTRLPSRDARPTRGRSIGDHNYDEFRNDDQNRRGGRT